MLGIPASVSVAILIIFTSLPFFSVYSERNIALPMPIGIAVRHDTIISSSVPTNAGSIDGVSE